MIQLNENGAMNFEKKIIFIHAKMDRKAKIPFFAISNNTLLMENMKYRQEVWKIHKNNTSDVSLYLFS